MNYYAVLDTNVLVSAMLHNTSVPGTVAAEALNGRIIPLYPHYLEHLMFKGSRQFGTTDYAKEAPLLKKISDLYEEHRNLTDPEERKAKYHEIDSVSQIAAQYNIPNEYDKMMSAIGSAGTNAYTSNDVTCYVENIPANEIERWCLLQSDRFQNLVMRGFHTELEAVYEEKNISMTKDGRKSTEALMRDRKSTRLNSSHQD